MSGGEVGMSWHGGTPEHQWRGIMRCPPAGVPPTLAGRGDGKPAGRARAAGTEMLQRWWGRPPWFSPERGGGRLLQLMTAVMAGHHGHQGRDSPCLSSAQLVLSVAAGCGWGERGAGTRVQRPAGEPREAWTGAGKPRQQRQQCEPRLR
jgi:hypothetical protein